jgi:hypothetical protein
VLEEAAAKHKQRMMNLARRLADLEPAQPRVPEKSESPTQSDKITKKSSNWLMLGLFATAAAALAIYQMQGPHSHGILGKKKRARSPEKRKR